MKVLVLGATGLLGNAVFRVLCEDASLEVSGTARSEAARLLFAPALADRLICAPDLEDQRRLGELLAAVRPDVAINCVAVGRPAPADAMRSVALYSVLPQRLAQFCRLRGIRMVQISSDGVFTGNRGAYTEDDVPDANDVYGVAKLLGEISGPHAITLRTSMIGHELQGRSGLLEWFLSQEGTCRCYSRALFSGLPTIELARVIRDVILPRLELHGLFHLATKPISKFDLLALVAHSYGKSIELVPDDSVVIDRSLVADRFSKAAGYAPPEWPDLIDAMRDYKFGLAGG
jgi:dTDP-4-dehydrorhamnose reductase